MQIPKLFRNELISEKGVLFELPEDLAEYVDPAIKAPLEKELRI